MWEIEAWNGTKTVESDTDVHTAIEKWLERHGLAQPDIKTIKRLN